MPFSGPEALKNKFTGNLMSSVSNGKETGGCPFKEVKTIPVSKSILVFTIVPEGSEKWGRNGEVD